jgi:hypothetical protein
LEAWLRFEPGTIKIRGVTHSIDTYFILQTYSLKAKLVSHITCWGRWERVKSTTVLIGITFTPVMATSVSRLARTPISPFQVPLFKTYPENLSSGS